MLNQNIKFDIIILIDKVEYRINHNKMNGTKISVNVYLPISTIIVLEISNRQVHYGHLLELKYLPDD